MHKNKWDWLHCNIPKYLTMLLLEWLEPSLVKELIQVLISTFSEYMAVAFESNAFILNYKIFLNDQLCAEATTDSKQYNSYLSYTQTATCIFQNSKVDIQVNSANLYFPLFKEIETIVPHQLYRELSNLDTYSKLDVNSLLNFCYNKGIKQSLKNIKMRKSFGLLNFNK